MPGHKGKSFLGCESLDITEIDGAGDLFASDGIIAESENNATRLFGTAHTYYSTEGSTLAIKAMLALAVLGVQEERRPVVISPRNAHKSFIHACALLDIDVIWLYPESAGHLCSARVSAKEIENTILSYEKVDAVYLTSPDYLGNIADVEGIANVCKAHGIPLLVDNAHGAYLNFLSPSCHPISLGADMCCDSAHKTLPVLTGGAYLHISKDAKADYNSFARSTLSVFASTSPSYLILESLDLCNKYLSENYTDRLSETVRNLGALKSDLLELGYEVSESEPLKLVIKTSKYGYTGHEVAEFLRKKNIEIEFFDGEYAVLMVTPENTEEDFQRLASALSELERKKPIEEKSELLIRGVKRTSIRKAVFSKKEIIPVDSAVGRVCATPTVSCPPAVPIAVSGEVITEEAVRLFRAYNITEVAVIKE